MKPEMVKQHPFLDRNRTSGYAYYVIPKAMLYYGKKLGIGTDEVLLYTILRERTKLSVKNGLFDSNGSAFIYYTRQEAAAYLGWSVRKTIDVFQTLVDHGLLSEVEEFTGKGKRTAKKLYVHTWLEPSYENNFSFDDLKALRFPPVTVQNIFSKVGDYYVLPKILMEHEIYEGLSLRAKLLYMVTLDRIQLSERYERYDENGLLWTTLDMDKLQEALGCSERSLSRAFKELEEIGLIERRAVAYAEKWRVYVRDYMPPADYTLSPTPTKSHVDDPSRCGEEDNPYSVANSAPLSRQICTTISPDLHDCPANFAPSEPPNLHPSNISPKNPLKKTSFEVSISAPHDAAQDAGCLPKQKEKNHFSGQYIETSVEAMELIHYDDTLNLIFSHCKPNDEQAATDILEECYEIIASDLRKSRKFPFVVIGKDSIPSPQLVEQYKKLNPYIMYIVIEKVLEQQHAIKDREAYIHRALYLAPQQHDKSAYYLRLQHERPSDPGSAGRSHRL